MVSPEQMELVTEWRWKTYHIKHSRQLYMRLFLFGNQGPTESLINVSCRFQLSISKIRHTNLFVLGKCENLLHCIFRSVSFFSIFAVKYLLRVLVKRFHKLYFEQK